MEDVDQQAFTYSEIKAMCTGDERCKELMQLTDEVKELKSMQQEYLNTHYELENKLNEYPTKRDKLVKEIDNLTQDIDVIRKLPIDPATELPKFAITINNVTYTDKTEAGRALDKACNKTFKNMFAKGESVNIGSMHGFSITAKCQKDLLSGTVFVQATIHGAANHTVDFGSAAHHNLRRLEGVFTSFEKILSEAQDHLNRLDVDMEEAKKMLNVPFDRKQELEDKSERMNELRDILHKEAQNKGSNKQRTYYFSMAQTKAIQPPEQPETPKPKAIEQQNNKPDVSDGDDNR